MIAKHILYMRFLCCLFLTFLVAIKAEAQLNHFIYIQTDNRQAFYVKLNQKLLSSSASGYLIIPKLKDGLYTLTIGFPNDEWPVQQMSIIVDNKDDGFLLKKFDDKGWGLFNLQSLEIVKGVIESSTNAIRSEQTTDAFSSTLAAVTNTKPEREKPMQTEMVAKIDSAKNQRSEMKEEVDSIIINSSRAKKEPANQVVEMLQKDDTLIQSQQFRINVVMESVNTESGIKQISSLLDTSGRMSMYVIAEGLQTDTVRILIQYNELFVAAAEPVKTAQEKEVEKPETAKVDKIDTAVTIPGKPLITEIKVSDVTPQSAAQPVITIINNDCKSIAEENDFLKLRKKMAAENKEEDMVEVARKSFKSKCYNSSQIKNLGLLFLKEENRYAFFDEAYKRVSDPGNFKELQSQLVTEYYINRFRAMLR